MVWVKWGEIRRLQTQGGWDGSDSSCGSRVACFDLRHSWFGCEFMVWNEFSILPPWFWSITVWTLPFGHLLLLAQHDLSTRELENRLLLVADGDSIYMSGAGSLHSRIFDDESIHYMTHQQSWIETVRGRSRHGGSAHSAVCTLSYKYL